MNEVENMEVKIKRHTLAALLELCKNYHPNEFIGLLEVEGGEVSTITVIPGSYHAPAESSYNNYDVPYALDVVGTAHSHPNGVALPSRADLRHFRSSGKVHAIIGYPYTVKNVAFFDGKGKRLDFKVV